MKKTKNGCPASLISLKRSWFFPWGIWNLFMWNVSHFLACPIFVVFLLLCFGTKVYIMSLVDVMLHEDKSACVKNIINDFCNVTSKSLIVLVMHDKSLKLRIFSPPAVRHYNQGPSWHLTGVEKTCARSGGSENIFRLTMKSYLHFPLLSFIVPRRRQVRCGSLAFTMELSSWFCFFYPPMTWTPLREEYQDTFSTELANPLW